MVSLLVLGLAGCGGTEQAEPVRAVPDLDTITVVSAPVAHERTWDGVVEAVHRVTVSAQTRGRVLALPFDVNDRVQAGDVIARFTDVEQRSSARQAQAAVNAAQASFTEAEADYQRILGIYERRLVSRAQRDQATARRDAAHAQLEAARAAVREVGEQVDYTQVRAPYAAIITQRHVEVGEAVQPGQPLVSAVSLDRLRLQVPVPQAQAGTIREQARAWLLLIDGRRIQADRVTVFPHADPDSHSVAVRVELPEMQTGMHPGMIAKVAFELSRSAQKSLPSSALIRRGELVGAYVLDERGRVGLRQLRVGRDDGDRVVVLAGLAEGERVIADPVRAQAWLADGAGAR